MRSRPECDGVLWVSVDGGRAARRIAHHLAYQRNTRRASDQENSGDVVEGQTGAADGALEGRDRIRDARAND